MKKCMYLLSVLFFVLTLSGCAEWIHMRYAEELKPSDYIMTKEEAYILQDGTTVSLWEPNENSTIHSYWLEDGQELLEVFLPIPIDRIQVQGLKGAKNMEQEARDAAIAYYDKLGLLLDIPALLEDAYTDYTLCLEEGKNFQPHFASQETEPCVETERFIGFMTTVEFPASAQYEDFEEIKQIALFDQNTGEVIPPEDLFTVSKEEAIQLLTECCEKYTEGLDSDDIRPLVSLDRAKWLQEGVLMYFYAYELPDEDCDWEVLIPYDELEESLQPWAIPVGK